MKRRDSDDIILKRIRTAENEHEVEKVIAARLRRATAMQQAMTNMLVKHVGQVAAHEVLSNAVADLGDAIQHDRLVSDLRRG
jgi:hypothetical protein